ncbi:hypothetical protein [Variovorax sp. W2I14]|uniref:hypothetical protein n=1 Tax=Variovorax sp. W2I14 TaxID=3042290 RepID=UPI003D219C88
MTSVVDTSVKYFSSQMSGAPVLSGTAGSIIALLDACLKDGFDIKTLASLTVAGGVATATYTGSHSAVVESVVQIAGVTGELDVLNGEQKITAKPGAGSVRFATSAPDGTAAGTVTMKMAPLGWLKPFSGPNLGAYKSGDPASTGMFLRVDDTNAATTRVVGYESMTDISSGVGAFPRNEVVVNGGAWGKSPVANSNPVGWVLIGDGRMFYLHISAYMGSAVGTYDRYTVGAVRGFGDMIALKPSGDAFACALSAFFNDPAPQWLSYPQYSTFDNASQSVYTARNHSGLGTAYAMASYPYTGQPSTVSGMDGTFGAFPSRIDGKLRLSPRYLRSFDTLQPEPRCEVPGLLTIPQNFVYGQISHRDIVPATGEYAGRKLLALTVGNGYSSDPTTSNNTGVTLIDITGPWR